VLGLQHRADGRYFRRLIGDKMNKHFEVDFRKLFGPIEPECKVKIGPTLSRLD
jgi:hypothetical protein